MLRHPSVVRRAAEEAESRNRGERVIDTLMNVRQINPVGLSAAHSSAVYGKNTYSADPGRSSDSKVFKAVDESAEDEAFEAQIFGAQKKRRRPWVVQALAVFEEPCPMLSQI
ncbi:hypothetical protein PG987_011491 [Apiospora arundinis]